MVASHWARLILIKLHISLSSRYLWRRGAARPHPGLLPRPPTPRLWRIFEEKVFPSQVFGFADRCPANPVSSLSMKAADDSPSPASRRSLGEGGCRAGVRGAFQMKTFSCLDRNCVNSEETGSADATRGHNALALDRPTIKHQCRQLPGELAARGLKKNNMRLCGTLY